VGKVPAIKDKITNAAAAVDRDSSCQKSEGKMPEYRYSPGDAIKYQNGKIAFTVRELLGHGMFGEVHKVQYYVNFSLNPLDLCLIHNSSNPLLKVYSEVQQTMRAMKCTKFSSMSQKERLDNFEPMCEEALLMVKLRHHPNIISLRFVKVSGAIALRWFGLLIRNNSRTNGF
jgi:serine/threonine protein kinase